MERFNKLERVINPVEGSMLRWKIYSPKGVFIASGDYLTELQTAYERWSRKRNKVENYLILIFRNNRISNQIDGSDPKNLKKNIENSRDYKMFMKNHKFEDLNAMSSKKYNITAYATYLPRLKGPAVTVEYVYNPKTQNLVKPERSQDYANSIIEFKTPREATEVWKEVFKPQLKEIKENLPSKPNYLIPRLSVVFRDLMDGSNSPKSFVL